MMNSAFDDITGNTDDYWPMDMREDIKAINARNYSDIRSGMYKSGFATTQPA